MTGKLVCIGLGITIGAHVSTRCQNHIAHADIVFCNCHPLMEQWLQELHPDVRSLQPLYAVGKDRRLTYQQMVSTMLVPVRQNRYVVGAFYGHPGVFAQVPHHAIAQARREGYSAHMEPGVSAEDCLYADLGIDPGAFGCQHFETSQFMFYQRRLDTCGYVILWQVALAGDVSLARDASTTAQREVLVSLLLEHYPPDHEVILYESPTLITDPFREDRIHLAQLAQANLTTITTLVIPPATRLVKNHRILDALAAAGAGTKDTL